MIVPIKNYWLFIMDFAYEMYSKLTEQKNLEKGGWQHCDMEYLLKRLDAEVAELKHEVTRRDSMSAERVTNEAADVANFVMMIQDNYRRDLHRQYARSRGDD